MNSLSRRLVLGLILASGLVRAVEPAAAAGTAEKPRNIILFIGDGMGTNHVRAAILQKAANRHQSPEATQLAFTVFSVTGKLATRSANSAVTDSAAAGTALACGVKTNNGVIGKDSGGRDVDSVAVLAKRQGKAVGILTSVGLDDATPAVFYAHAASRKELDGILDQAFTSTAYDVLMGGGVMGKGWPDAKLRDRAAAAGLFYVNAAGLAALAPAATAGKRVFGCFDLNGDTMLNLMASRQPGDREPRLADITCKALEILCNRSGTAGFFLMVEGGAIDKASHKNNTAGMLGEMLELDQVVADAVAFLKGNGELGRTLIMVTADHETGGLTLAAPAKAGAPGVTWGSTNHTATDVPLFATGPGAPRFAGPHDNTDVAKLITLLLQP